MRHVLPPRAIPTRALGMRQTTPMAQLITSPGSALRLAPGATPTVTDAVPSAAIAPAADDRQATAAATPEHPRRDGVDFLRPADPVVTGAAIAAILPPHTCPGTVWRTVPKQLARLGSAPCLPPMVRLPQRLRQPSQSRSIATR